MSAPIRQPIVVVLGHVDSGKCVSGETLLQLADGSLIRADHAFRRFRIGNRYALTDGEAYRAKGLRLLSVNTSGKVVSSKVSHVWRLKADTTLKIQTDAGISIECTPEHRLLTRKMNGTAAFTSASKLTAGDDLLVPRGLTPKKAHLSGLKSRLFYLLPERCHLQSDIQNRNLISGSSGKDFHSDRTPPAPTEPTFETFKMKRRTDTIKTTSTRGKEYDRILYILSPRSKRTRLPLILKPPKTLNEFIRFYYLAGFAEGERQKLPQEHHTHSQEVLHRVFGAVTEFLGSGMSGFPHGMRQDGPCVPLQIRCITSAFVGINNPAGQSSLGLRYALLFHLPEKILLGFLRGFFDSLADVDQEGGVVIHCRRARLCILRVRIGCIPRIREDGSLSIQEGESLEVVVDKIGFFDARRRVQVQRLLQSHTNSALCPASGKHLTYMPSSAPAQNSSLNVLSPPGSDTVVSTIQNRSGFSLQGLLALGETAPAIGQTTEMATVKVTGIEVRSGMRTVYDFTVEGFHNFLANGLVAHNTSLLDRLRGTAVQSREAGGITQQIGASFFPPETLVKICGPLLKMFGGNVQVPGLLVIDTPGHEAFANLRSRGGSAADIAILVVDVTKGLENQTLESIEILRSRKVPFVVALSKIDLLAGWRPDPNSLVKDASVRLQPATLQLLDEAIYRVVGQLSRVGFASEAYYRVKDFTREVSIVPVSSKTGEGIAELLAIVVGLSQQYLAKKLKASSNRTRGIVLEVNEEPGLGPTANVILVDGTLKVGSKVVVAKRDSAEAVKVRALLLPKPLDEMRDPRDRFESVQEIAAAAGVKLSAPDLGGVLAGSPLLGVSETDDEEDAKRQVMSEVKTAIYERKELGVILKADTLGALEALSNLLKKQGIPVRVADIGPVTKGDVVQASSVRQDDRYLGVILAFNVKVLEDAEQEAATRGVKIFNENVIYTLIDSYVTWVGSEKENEARATFSSIVLPCKFRIMKGFIFRRNDPAVFGVEVITGTLRQKAKVMNSRGEEVGSIQQIQHEGQNITEARAGDKVAVSMKEPTVGRQVKEGEELYTLPESVHARMLIEKYAERLSPEEKDLLKEIVSIRRKVHISYAF